MSGIQPEGLGAAPEVDNYVLYFRGIVSGAYEAHMDNDHKGAGQLMPCDHECLGQIANRLVDALVQEVQQGMVPQSSGGIEAIAERTQQTLLDFNERQTEEAARTFAVRERIATALEEIVAHMAIATRRGNTL